MKYQDEVKLSLRPYFHCGFDCGYISDDKDQMKGHLETEHGIKLFKKKGGN